MRPHGLPPAAKRYDIAVKNHVTTVTRWLVWLIVIVFAGCGKTEKVQQRADGAPAQEEQPPGGIVVTTAKYGNLRERDLAYLRIRRQMLVQFLSRAISLTTNDPEQQRQRMMALGDLQNCREQSVVMTWLLAEHAAAQRLQVERSEIDEFLKGQTQERLGSSELDALLKEVGLSRDALFDALSHYLLARKAVEQQTQTAKDVSDEDLREYFVRAHRTAEIEAVPVLAERFVDEVPQPSDAALREFFETHRGRYPDPASPEPGFRRPVMLAFEYFRAKTEDIDREAVTEEEIRDFYEQNRNLFKRVSLPSSSSQSGEQSSEGDSEVEHPLPRLEVASPPGDAEPGPAKSSPLEEVRDEIRQRLARQKASERIEHLFANLAYEVQRYREGRILHEMTEKEGGDAKPPKPPDWAALAEREGLVWASTGLLTALEAESQFGRAALGHGGIPFVSDMFRDPVEFRPRGIVDPASDDHYLVWVTEIQEDYIPNWDEPGIREEATRAWKTLQARELARAEGERLAALARDAGKPLAELFAGKPDLPVIRPAPFTWLSELTDLPLPSLPLGFSEVEGVPYAGAAFMKAVFELEEGGIAVAPNYAQTAFYVVRLVRFSPSLPELKKKPETENLNRYKSTILMDRRQAWWRRIEQEAGLRWVRDPTAWTD
jgi:hypothetical protein